MDKVFNQKNLDKVEDLIDDLISDEMEQKAMMYSKIILQKLDKFCEATGISTETLMYIFLGICMVYVLVGVFKEIIATMVGTVYPIFKSLEALENNN